MVRYGVQGGAVPVFLFAIGSFVFGDAIPITALFVAAPLGGALGTAYGLAWYLRFTYELTDETLDITSGVIARRDREIPYRRVQTVDVTRTILARVFGLAAVHIETAGGGSTEASLEFVSATRAEELRDVIRTRREQSRGATRSSADGERSESGTATEQTAHRRGEEIGAPPRIDAATDDQPTVLFRLSLRELLLYSLLTFRSGAVAIVLFALPVVQGYVPQDVFSLIEALGGATTVAAMTPGRALVTAGIALPLVLGSAYVVSAAYGAVTYYGFTLAQRGDDLVYECGLVQRYSGSIPLSKVQSLTLTENVPMRRFGYAGLTIETAGYAGGDASGLTVGSGPPSAIPAAQRETALAVARHVEAVGAFDIERPPSTARRRYAVRYALVVTAAVVATTLLARFSTAFDAWYLPAAVLPVVPLAAHLKWRHRGHDADETHAVFRTGFWSRRTTIVPYERLQTMTRSRTVFQRRLGLADFVADTASAVSITGSPPIAFDVDDDVAARLHRRCRERLQSRLHADGASTRPAATDGKTPRDCTER